MYIPHICAFLWHSSKLLLQMFLDPFWIHYNYIQPRFQSFSVGSGLFRKINLLDVTIYPLQDILYDLLELAKYIKYIYTLCAITSI